jgi:anhydro-N-acetylmuramic acid kinase
MTNLCIGLMSGTSLDGVDAVLVRMPHAREGGTPQTVAGLHHAYPAELRRRVLALCQGQPVTLAELGAVDQLLARCYTNSVQALLQHTGTAAAAVRVIGCHGQTVHHQPGGDTPFTLQLGDPNRLAAATGITVVADFRRRDMALGGQGAPLAPGFHDLVFRHPQRPRVVLNLGGIANISLLLPGRPCTGFDTGPANILMDAWVQACRGEPCDRDGAWALQGRIDAALLAALRSDPYFALPPPKSTGREHFHLAWLQRHLQAHAQQTGAVTAEADVQRTLLELTAGTVSDAIVSACQDADMPVAAGEPAARGEILAAGGGAANGALLQRLAALNPGWDVASTASVGLAPEWVEATAFAVFAQRTLDGLPASLPSVTGASRACLLGGIFPP